MYCPRCAAQNSDDAKFCRGCGAGLENVALALSGYLQLEAGTNAYIVTPTAWLNRRKEGITSLVKAGGLLGSSFLIGAALGLFSDQSDWIIIWMIFAGWMACWGMFSLVSGINSLIDSRFMHKQAHQARLTEPWRAAEREVITGELVTPSLSAPRSVTEHTTRALNQPGPTSKENG
jgi:hypothetical protein